MKNTERSNSNLIRSDINMIYENPAPAPAPKPQPAPAPQQK